MRKHFVTGAAGFLGSHIVEKLYQMGETDIIAFDILKCDQLFKGVEYVEGSVLDRESGISYVSLQNPYPAFFWVVKASDIERNDIFHSFIGQVPDKIYPQKTRTSCNKNPY